MSSCVFSNFQDK